MLALVLAALAPTLAQAVVKASERSDWLQVCSATGMVWIQADAVADNGSSPASNGLPLADMGMQCPWCQLHSPVAGLPPAPQGLAVTAARVPWRGAAITAAPPAGVWIAAPARAPPPLA